MSRAALLLSGALLGAGLLVSARGSAAPAAPVGDALGALKSQIADLERRLGDGQGPPQRRACKLNSQGACVYTPKQHREAQHHREAAPVVDPDGGALIAAYEAFLADPTGEAAPEAAAYRYHLARLLTEIGAGARARPHLERLTDGSEAGPRAAWAAMLLVDVLVREWTEGPPELRDAAGGDLERGLARLRAAPLWQTDAANDLRAAAPIIDAGLRWARAESHRRRGTQADEPHAAAAAFSACGRDFQALHADHGARHDRASALLWHAAECFEAAYQLGAALRLFASLVETYPHSEFVEQATLHSAEIYDALARYGEAVEWYERLAATHPRSRWTPDALARAVALRAALGPPKRLVDALAGYEALYAQKDPKRAAEIRWSGYASVPRDDAARRVYLEQFLLDHGDRAPPGLWLRASAELARLRLRETCPRDPTLESLCLAAARGPSAPVSPTKSAASSVVTTRWSSSRRRDARYEAALREAAAVRAYARARRHELRDQRSAAMAAEAVAAAALLQADAALEAILVGRPRPQIRGPLHLTLEEATPGAAPGVVFPLVRLALATRAGLSDSASEDVDAIDEAYAAIVTLFPGSPAAIQARARQGLIRGWLAERAALALAAGSSAVDRHMVMGLRAEAIVAYRRCLAPEPAALAASASVAHCERGLAALSPREPGIVAELLGRELSSDAPARPDVAGLVLDADEALRLGAWVAADAPSEDPG